MDCEADGVPHVVEKLVKFPVVDRFGSIKLKVIFFAESVMSLSVLLISVPDHRVGLNEPEVNALVGGVVHVPVGGIR